MARAVLWTALAAALASISLVAPSPQRVEEHVLRRKSQHRINGFAYLLQLSFSASDGVSLTRHLG